MTTTEYIESIDKRYKSGISREHSYRGDFENLFRQLIKGVEITNEPANITDCGNPDYVITKGKIPIGYIEAKDVGKDLKSKSYREQFGRYKKALDNLIITDYIRFQFFQNGKLIHEIRIAEIDNGIIKPVVDNFEKFENLLSNFSTFIGQTIKSSKRLAEMMAAKARLLQNILERAVTSDEETKENTSIQSQYLTFKQILIHDLTPKDFADIYAQTLAYGMFAARLHDPTLDDFSRQEAAELIPKSNPFLRKLFGYVAGPDIDERIKTTVDNLAEVFRATNVEQLLKNFGSSKQQNDPIIHFYETFLAEYDPKLRKSRGVWYTPEPVVKFIVRAVDDILKSEFGLSEGLADTSKTEIDLKVATHDKRSTSGYKTIKKEVHKVQILDPATGTGTFLAEVIKHIYNTGFKAMQGAWSRYVQEHLIPRLNGFELLMASYSMAHLKLDMLLTETGYKSKGNQRFNVFLTNSLEEHHPDTGTLFSNWLSSEANEANHIKRDTPVMCIIGNPPYSVSSSNKSDWIEELMKDYKKDLNEKNINPLSDDYLKFMRYSQFLIEMNEEGILAFISNNSFIDGLIHRQFRKQMLSVFDTIYILDLHGSALKKEKTPDRKPDKNVFDIQQGVAISIFVKNKIPKRNKKILHFDLMGTREIKYSFLYSKNLRSIPFTELNPQEPNFFFSPKDLSHKEEYDKGFKLTEIFLNYASGVKTERDSLVINFEKTKIEQIKQDLVRMEPEEFRKEYNERKDGRDWKIGSAQEDLRNNKPTLVPIHYRPFDYRWTYYTGFSKGIHAYPRNNVFKHLQLENNQFIIFERSFVRESFTTIFISEKLLDLHILGTAFSNGYTAPLYLKQQSTNLYDEERILSNLNEDIVNEICNKVDLSFSLKENSTKTNIDSANILDYIYAVLHSPYYREKYKEFLKIDFPRVPYPKDSISFWKLVELGRQIRSVHLLESKKVTEYITSYPKDGDNTITRKIVKNDWELYDEINQHGRIWINKDQYFDKIPLTAWEFYIGGYQPAQKWLKDRKGRTLNYEDILHYQKIIVALVETDRLMKEIDKIEIE